MPHNFFGALCGALFLFLFSASAQDCGTSQIYERTLREHPHLHTVLDKQEHQRVAHQSSIQERAKTTGTVYTVPVVVHLIHNNGPENLTDLQVQNAITLANTMFRHEAPWDGAGGADAEIQFCLAKQDPSGNPTTGINRVADASKTNHTYYSSAVDMDLKNLIRWDPKRYINIWVVRSISGPVAGYAMFPASFVHGAAMDGIVIEYGHLATNSLTHEFGHYFNLHHTFNGGCINNNCELEGDCVCDTPPVGNSSGCSRNSCFTDEDDASTNNPFRTPALGGMGEQSDMANNHMDYSPAGCRRAFSPGQIARMRYALTNYRASLLTSFGCIDPCPAVINFQLMVPAVTAGSSFSVINTSTNATIWQWYINNVLISSAQNLTHTFSNGGIYTIKLIASNANISCTRDTSFSLQVVCPSMSASFTADLNPALAGQMIQFTNTSTTVLDTTGKNFWYVDNVLTSNTKDVSFALNVPGFHNVKLIVGNNSSSCTSEHVLPIQINCGAQANFTLGATNVAISTLVNFTNSSTGATSYEWLLNSFPISSAINYAHTFSSEGDYMITLVADNGICRDTLHQIISVFNPSACRSNKQHDNWYFGNTAAVNFSGGPPVALLSSVMNAPEGVATISNGSGNLLFYSDGVTVWDRTHNVMLNGSGLSGNKNATQSALILQQPGVDSLYYIFTNTAYNASGILSYSVVNMNLNGGLGGIIPAQKNIILVTGVTEKMAATYHGNGCYVWIMTHKASSAEYLAFMLSASGIGSSVSSVTGLSHTSTKGQIKFSSDGQRLSAAHQYENMEVFDFNNFTGVLSNGIILNDKYSMPYGTEFSPDNSKVYYTARTFAGGSQGGSPSAVIVQFDLSSGTAAAIKASATVVGTLSLEQPSYEALFGALQLGKDGKIYVVAYDRMNPQTHLHRISAPNITGTGCNYQQNAVSLSGRNTTLGLPAILSSSLNTVSFEPLCNSSNHQQVQFSITSGGSAAGTYYWEFGDPASGSLNYSDQPSPSHTFTAPGTYTVTLVVKKYCQCATISKQITVPFVCTLPSDLFSFNVLRKQNSDLLMWSVTEHQLIDHFEVARSIDLREITEVAEVLSAGTQYEFEAVVPMQLKPETRYYRIKPVYRDGSYSLSEWKSAAATAQEYMIFPNPAKDNVKIVALQSAATSLLRIYSSLGVLQREMIVGTEAMLSTVNLEPGVYLFILHSASSIEQHRVVIAR